ncbi:MULTISPECIES: hypothetical protein [Rhizobium]|uniref:Type IV secretion system lipoprotein VirB7 2 n=1 Tax=Rhizobium phaseoli TaxID=396 RepID=A0ABM6CLN5_9HYPH|nr:hypothetical protein [Rhizobium phaseoli]ANL57361.1 type IV secretion system lipoprotein VirB7 2 [Rhizobium phaseoli]ANL89259.1 type IV secretion system lipoprotein VirB7 2 [Rhizobium phaseoli]ANL95768.1 type IV secretion system lipoprotein VirB7 2 [Rhizobium phaseoli]ANM08373.1 type IV secretion system lipoprotein VirB7 2 [Rhizobium phaseoli]PDS68651.1 hypothetical protein CO651_27945 [Rhizobium phaseoli]
MIRIVLSLLLTIGLAGCGSISHPLPKCDGYSRRQLNRAMWQWHDNGFGQPSAGAGPAEPTSLAASYVPAPSAPAPAAFGHFDVAGSYRPCEGVTW